MFYPCGLQHFREAWVVVDPAVQNVDARLQQLHARAQRRDAAIQGVVCTAVHGCVWPSRRIRIPHEYCTASTEETRRREVKQTVRGAAESQLQHPCRARDHSSFPLLCNEHHCSIANSLRVHYAARHAACCSSYSSWGFACLPRLVYSPWSRCIPAQATGPDLISACFHLLRLDETNIFQTRVRSCISCRLLSFQASILSLCFLPSRDCLSFSQVELSANFLTNTFGLRSCHVKRSRTG